MRLARRQFLQLATGAATLSAAPCVVRAQAYPTRSISIIVPFAPGGATDVSARIAGEHMSGTLGQGLVVENFPGAGGTTGSIRAMRAAPDGYTIEMGHIGTHAISVWLYPQLAYKPDVDFEPIGLTMETPLVIVPGGIYRLRESKFRETEHGACRRRIDYVQLWSDARFHTWCDADFSALQWWWAGRECAAWRPD